MRRCTIRLLQNLHSNSSTTVSRCHSSTEAVERRSHLFTLEKQRQLEAVGRIEKVEVRYTGLPQERTLIMNKDISTPHDCARHISQFHAESSALALINGTVYWDMHRPITENCTLDLLNFTIADPFHVNKAFWRTCSFVLGACVSAAFRSSVPVHLHSFPGPDVRSGSFIYDVSLPSLEAWSPTDVELRSLSAEFVKLCRRTAPIERLEVSQHLATEMFTDNEHKSRQIPSIAAKTNGTVTLYRIEKHVDISRGPMISNTAQIGRVTVAAVHRITGDTERGGAPQLYRFQGVALPAGIIINHFAYGILEERARKLNRERSPYDRFDAELSGHQVAATA